MWGIGVGGDRRKGGRVVGWVIMKEMKSYN